MSNNKLKYYQPGYSVIHPLSSMDNELWKYAVQIHKNQNGTHFDLRLYRPIEKIAYSWSLKKVPFLKGHEKLGAFRTYDHNHDDMLFEGFQKTASGHGTKKVLAYGSCKIMEIDKTAGLTFNIDSDYSLYTLRPIKGKRYLLKELAY